MENQKSYRSVFVLFPVNFTTQKYVKPLVFTIEPENVVLNAKMAIILCKYGTFYWWKRTLLFSPFFLCPLLQTKQQICMCRTVPNHSIENIHFHFQMSDFRSIFIRKFCIAQNVCREGDLSFHCYLHINFHREIWIC